MKNNNGMTLITMDGKDGYKFTALTIIELAHIGIYTMHLLARGLAAATTKG